MKIIKQSTYETCLACCLLMMTGGIRKDEIEIWKRGWRFNYLIGQLNYVVRKYDREFEVYVENKYYFNQLQKQKGRGIKLVNKKIDTKLLNRLLEIDKVIVYLDSYYPYNARYVHAPHFVIAARKIKGDIEVADPFDGKLKKISISTIKKGINSLRNYLKYSPVLITISVDRN